MLTIITNKISVHVPNNLNYFTSSAKTSTFVLTLRLQIVRAIKEIGQDDNRKHYILYYVSRHIRLQ